jgi:hypothetical protein
MVQKEEEMSVKNTLRYLLIAIIIVGLLLFLNLRPKTVIPTTKADTILRLQAPPFVSAAEVQGIIEDEAGISAWFRTPSTINLNSVRSSFRTIEIETTDYILGSVPVPDYDESWDVHVYVHKDGWILAYYLAQDPVGKIYDWKAYHNSGRTTISTKLENVIAVIANAAGFPFSSANVTYYDFRYPNATHLMLIVEWVYIQSGSESDSFQFKLPGSFAYYQQSWSLANNCTASYSCSSRYLLNGAEIKRLSMYGAGWQMAQGTFSVAQLPPDQYHTIEISVSGGYQIYGYGGLALVYRVP